MLIGSKSKRKPGAHISVAGVHHRYRRASSYALEDVAFEVLPCEAVALIGMSGCGKSTLLHVISGLMAPSAGEIRIDGALVERPSPSWVVMFQQPHLYPWMSVERNVGLGLRFAGRSRSEIKERVLRLLKLVDLEGYGERNAQELSGGQQQRVALARSLAVDPEVLLLDEPFSALDAMTRRALQRDVRRLAQEIGITVVLVTHDIAEAVAMSDRAIMMAADPGRISDIVPIRLSADERHALGPEIHRVQQELQLASERAALSSSRRAEPAKESRDPIVLEPRRHSLN